MRTLAAAAEAEAEAGEEVLSSAALLHNISDSILLTGRACSPPSPFRSRSRGALPLPGAPDASDKRESGAPFLEGISCTV